MSQLTPPTPAVRPETLELHGHQRVDNYYWLRERENPEVIAYLEAENEYTKQVMGHTETLQQTLYEEMVGRIQETDEEVPARLGDYYYYTRTEAGQQYPLYCRKKGSLDAAEEMLLNPNTLAEGHDYLSVGIYEISPNHQLLAYSIDTEGDEHYTIFFKDLQTGQLLDDQIHNTAYEAAWANDNQTFFYATVDETWRTDKVWRHRLGTAVDKDEMIFHEEEAIFSVGIEKTKDDAYLIVDINSIESGELYILDANTPTAAWRLIHPRQPNVRYTLEHHSGTFYIVTNEEAPNYKVMSVSADNPAKENWRTYIEHDTDVYIRWLDTFANHLIIAERRSGLSALRVIDLRTQTHHYVAADEPVYTIYPTDNLEFHTATLRYAYESMTTPKTIYDYEMDQRTRELKKQVPVLGGYDPQNYRSERIWATAEDGTQVPISLVYRRDTTIAPTTPCFMRGYGSYGAVYEPSFDLNRISLLDRGFVFAIAHIRGGGEMGRHWYDQGKFLHKKNTFTDFVACAKHLIEQGYTSSDKLVINGRSAGGLLMGAVLNLAPELFKEAVAGVAFVDVITTMLDESIPLTVGEFEEWGNPKDKTYYDYMLSYSPYDQLEAKGYPHILATAGLNDPRVQYWEPTKWVAKLRTLKT
ncbi:MAG: S9 family peptidase, partial [Anaerolineales bacterium]|nr:S9 family peptidase [Anaerolineales bacterium]